jgi:hypothetical protein
MDAWRPVPTAYGACSNTESANRLEGAVSAIGINSSAGTVIGKHRRVSVIHSRLWVRSEARWLRGVRQRPWRHGAGGHGASGHGASGIAGDLALLLAARSQHDGIDWDRLVCPAAHGLARPAAHGQLARPAAYGQLGCPAAHFRYDGIDWDCARDQGERVP